MSFDFPNTPTLGQIFQGYTWDGEKWGVTFNAPNQGGVIAIKVFTASGTYTPSPNMTTCVIECVGGGGAGGGVAGTVGQIYAAAGGGSGGWSQTVATAAMIGPSQTVTIGAGGLAAAAGANAGLSGADTSVGTLCIAKGGIGGNPSSAASVPSPGLGGIAGTGNVTAPGVSGHTGFNNSGNITTVLNSGNGGSSKFGGGGVGVWATTAGSPATGYGSGGAGGSIYNSGAATTGGAGSPGVVIITEYGLTSLGSSTAASGAVRYDLPQGLTGTQQAQGRANIGSQIPNVLINGDFRIQQDTTYVSGAALAAGAYGHDQWKAGASGGDYSFTQLVSSTQITIAAGKSLIQPVENVRVVGGSYVLTWTGTAQARAGVNTLTPSGAYVASPLLITGQTAGTVMSVEFNAGTLGTVKLESGSIATPFVVPDYASELAVCKRYYVKLSVGTGPYTALGTGLAASASVGSFYIKYPVTMRGSPSTGYGGNLACWNGTTFYPLTGSLSAYVGLDSMMLQPLVVGSMTPGAAMQLCGNNDPTAYLTFNARL